MRRWSFLVPIVAFTLVCSVITWGILHFLQIPMGQKYWGVISYFMVLTLVLHAWQERSLAHDPAGFIRRYLAGLTVKMFLSFLVLVLLLMLAREEQRLPLALTFILLYLAYLGFSTARMAMVLRQRSRR